MSEPEKAHIGEASSKVQNRVLNHKDQFLTRKTI